MVHPVTLVLLVTAALLSLNVVLHNRQQRHTLSAMPEMQPAAHRGMDEVGGLRSKVAELQSQLAMVKAKLPTASLRESGHAEHTERVDREGKQNLPFEVEPRGWHDQVQDIPANSTVWVTFVNGDVKYREMMMNWAYHLRQLNVPHLVVAFDDVAADACKEVGIPYMRHVETLVSGDFRADFTQFRKMGSNKPLIVLRLLEEHALDAVIISDVDTVWMRSPVELLQRHEAADVLISTDCLSHAIEDAHHKPSGASSVYYHRCGHLPGATFGRAFNTGVIIFRRRPAALEALREWRAALTDPERAYAPSKRGGAFAVTDQLAFNMILERNITPIVPSAEDARVIMAMDQRLRLMPLPSLLFTNGHVHFYQHLPDRYRAKPFVVHCTFQRHHTPGKRARLREAGLWLVDPPDYFQADRLMTYDNDVTAYIDALQAKASAAMPPLLKHFHAMAYQIAALRDAFALARVLRRVLVLPRFKCYCDQDWYASVLTGCRVDGSDLELPFVCPLDVLLSPGRLDSQDLPYRMAAYLTDARTPVRVTRSEEVATFIHPESCGEDGCPAWNGAVTYVAEGANATAASAQLPDLLAVHVLVFSNLRPGVFGGFATAEEDAAFDAAFDGAMGQEAKWCCSGEQPIDVGWITWWYELPAPLSQRGAMAEAWKVPTLHYPSHCDKIKSGDAGQLNIDFLQQSNHPCSFLARNFGLPRSLHDVMPVQQVAAVAPVR